MIYGPMLIIARNEKFKMHRTIRVKNTLVHPWIYVDDGWN